MGEVEGWRLREEGVRAFCVKAQVRLQSGEMYQTPATITFQRQRPITYNANSYQATLDLSDSNSDQKAAHIVLASPTRTCNALLTALMLRDLRVLRF